MRVADPQDALGDGRHGSLHASDCRLRHSRRRNGRLRDLPHIRMYRGPGRHHSQVGTTPKSVSTDHDPLFEFHHWKANLRILESHEIKTVPDVPLSHPFVERLIGSICREIVDHVPFWTRRDLERKLASFREFYNQAPSHRSIDGNRQSRHCAVGERQTRLNGNVIAENSTSCRSPINKKFAPYRQSRRNNVSDTFQYSRLFL